MVRLIQSEVRVVGQIHLRETRHFERTYRELDKFETYIGRAIRTLRALEPLVQFFRRLQTLIGRRIQLLLNLLRLPLFLQKLVLIEIHFFEYHGLGRPPQMVTRAQIAGLSQVTGRVCSSPALA